MTEQLKMVKEAAHALRDAPPWEKIRAAEQLGAAMLVWCTALEGRVEKLEQQWQRQTQR